MPSTAASTTPDAELPIRGGSSSLVAALDRIVETIPEVVSAEFRVLRAA